MTVMRQQLLGRQYKCFYISFSYVSLESKATICYFFHTILINSLSWFRLTWILMQMPFGIGNVCRFRWLDNLMSDPMVDNDNFCSIDLLHWQHFCMFFYFIIFLSAKDVGIFYRVLFRWCFFLPTIAYLCFIARSMTFTWFVGWIMSCMGTWTCYVWCRWTQAHRIWKENPDWSWFHNVAYINSNCKSKLQLLFRFIFYVLRNGKRFPFKTKMMIKSCGFCHVNITTNNYASSYLQAKTASFQRTIYNKSYDYAK